MLDVEGELRAMRAQVDRMRLRQRRLVALLGSVALVGAVGAILFYGRTALSDPASPLACGHASQLYCFQQNQPALASQVNSNFESAFQGLDKKMDKTGGTFTGDVTMPNLILSGGVSLGQYAVNSSGSGGGSTALCNLGDLVAGGQAQCPAGSPLLAAGSTFWGVPNNKWGYYGTCANGATVNVTAYCLSKARP